MMVRMAVAVATNSTFTNVLVVEKVNATATGLVKVAAVPTPSVKPAAVPPEDPPLPGW